MHVCAQLAFLCSVGKRNGRGTSDPQRFHGPGSSCLWICHLDLEGGLGKKEKGHEERTSESGLQETFVQKLIILPTFNYKER